MSRKITCCSAGLQDLQRSGNCTCALGCFPAGICTWQKNDYQEVLLDGDCVGYLLGVVMGVIIVDSVGKPDGDKVGC